MELENYFDFLLDTDIRVKGTRVGIETIILDYLELGLSPEEIAAKYPTLKLEQVYATLTYYWHNRPQVQEYIEKVSAEILQQREEQARNPSPLVVKLRELALKRGMPITQPTKL